MDVSKGVRVGESTQEQICMCMRLYAPSYVYITEPIYLRAHS